MKNNRKNRRPSRNILIRFCRSIYRIWRLIFKPVRKQVSNSPIEAPVAELIDRYPTSTDLVVELENIDVIDDRDRHESKNIDFPDRIDVVELVDSSPQIAEIPPSITDKYLTVGQLFALVNWQIPEPIEQKTPVAVEVPKQTIATDVVNRSKMVNVSKISPADDYVTVGELFTLVNWQPDRSEKSDATITDFDLN
jgi:sulfur carrier protein ThiS